MKEEKEWNKYIESSKKELDEVNALVSHLLLECRRLKQENKQLLKKVNYGKTNKQGKVR